MSRAAVLSALGTSSTTTDVWIVLYRLHQAGQPASGGK
jgi:hypothetical protein